MAYTKTDWVNGQAPYINADNMNKIENGIYNNDANIGDLNSLETTEKNNLTSAVNEVKNDVTNVSDEINDIIGDLSGLNTTEKSNVVSAINEVYQNNTYLTNETLIGRWVDGLPLYRKVILHTFTSYTTSNYVNVNTGLSSSDNICKIEGIAQRSQGFANGFGYFLDAVVMQTHTVIRVIDNQNVLDSGTKIYIILEYTKTT